MGELTEEKGSQEDGGREDVARGACLTGWGGPHPAGSGLSLEPLEGMEWSEGIQGPLGRTSLEIVPVSGIVGFMAPCVLPGTSIEEEVL